MSRLRPPSGWRRSEAVRPVSPKVVRYRKAGNLLFIGGAGPWDGSGYPYLGKLGRDLDADQGYEAGRVSALHMLSIIKHAVGDLDKVRQFLYSTCFIQCVAGFTELSKVSNGASELIVDLFGMEKGTHARSSIGVSDLAHNIPFEMVMELEVDS